MPPWPHWYQGRDAIRRFLHWGMRRERRSRLLPTRANGQLAFALYTWRAERPADGFDAFAVMLPAFDGDTIAGVTFFVDKQLVMRFGLPASFAAE